MKKELFRLRDTPQNKFKRLILYLILFCGGAAFMAEFLNWYILFLFTLLILFMACTKKKYHYYRSYIVMRRIKKILEENFLDLGMYTTNGDRITHFPWVIIKPNAIVVKYNNSLRFKKILEANVEKIGSILPDGWQIKDQFEISNGYKIIFKNGEDDRIFIDNLSEYKELIYDFSESEVPLDKEIKLDFNKDPHLLISAKTGAGKTYLIRGLILSLYLNKRPSKVFLNDINQSNRDLYGVCSLNGSKDEILSNLNYINEELKLRADNFEKIDEFERIVIILEEYLAFINSLDKKDRSEVEKILKIIAATGRKYKINLILITQISSASEINSGIRSNMTNLVLGRLDKSQRLSLSVQAPIENFGENVQGQAAISQDGRFISFLTPTISFENVLNEISNM